MTTPHHEELNEPEVVDLMTPAPWPGGTLHHHEEARQKALQHDRDTTSMDKVIFSKARVNRQAIVVSIDSKLLSMQSTIVQDTVLFNHDPVEDGAD